jgi:hypothetical protein
MLNNEKLCEFLDPIIKATMPDEIQAWEVGGRVLVDDALSGSDLTESSKSLKGEHQFLAEAKAVLEFIVLISTTVEAVRKLIPKKEQETEQKSSETSELGEQWARKMEAGGISKSKAQLIAARFSSKLTSLTSD